MGSSVRRVTIVESGAEFFTMACSCLITGTIFESAILDVIVRLVMVLYMSNWASRQGKDYRTNNKNKEGWLNCSHLAWELLSTRYWRKDIRKDRSDRKMGKKTSASTGWSYRRRRVPEIERGSASSHCVENCGKRLWTCRKTDYGLIDFTILIYFWEFAHPGLGYALLQLFLLLSIYFLFHVI
jgi:hypothetical protein